MKITRRKFIEAGSIAAGSLFALKSIVLGQSNIDKVDPIRVEGDKLAQLAWNDFYKYQNTDFSFSKLGMDPVTMTLASVEDSRPATKRKWGVGQECFVLKFRTSSRTELSQDTYDVSHFALGDFRLFIVGGRVGRQSVYNAVINRVTTI